MVWRESDEWDLSRSLTTYHVVGYVMGINRVRVSYSTKLQSKNMYEDVNIFVWFTGLQVRTVPDRFNLSSTYLDWPRWMLYSCWGGSYLDANIYRPAGSQETLLKPEIVLIILKYIVTNNYLISNESKNYP